MAGLRNVNNIWHVTRKLTALRLTFLAATCLAIGENAFWRGFMNARSKTLILTPKHTNLPPSSSASLIVLIINGLVGLQDSIKAYEENEATMEDSVDTFLAAKLCLVCLNLWMNLCFCL